MEVFGAVIGAVVQLMQTPISIYGVSTSYWQVLIWVMVASLFLGFIGRIYYGS